MHRNLRYLQVVNTTQVNILLVGGVKVVHLCKLCNCFISKYIHNGNPDLKWMGLDSILTCYYNTSNSHQLFKPYSHWESRILLYLSIFHEQKVWFCVQLVECFRHRSALASAHQGQPLPKTLSVMESTPQVRGMHTIIRYELTAVQYFSHTLLVFLL